MASAKWLEIDMESALEEVKSGSLSIRAAGIKYGIPESTIRLRKNQLMQSMDEEFPALSSGGRKQELQPHVEESLAECIRVLCQNGFSPRAEEVLNLVQEYLQRNNIQTKFKENLPKRHWLENFMKRNNLSLKKANLISKARKSTTSNPFLIFGFYEMLQKIVEENNLGPSQVWNCDESGFPADPASCQVVGPRGAKTFKVTCGPSRQNTTILAACNADGKALLPMVVFKGKNFQSSWKSKFYL